MSRALEIVRFTVKPEHEPALLESRPQVVDALRRFPGFVSATLARVDERTWVDTLVWESREQAEAAQAEAPNVPELAPVFELVDELLAFEHADVVHAA